MADGTVSYKKWKIPDPHFGISSLIYDHKQPLIATSASGGTTYTAPTYINCDFSSFELTSITRMTDYEVGAYTDTYALQVVGTLVFKSFDDLTDVSNLAIYYKSQSIESSSFSKTIVTDIDGNFKYSLINISINRLIYLDNRKYKEYLIESYTSDPSGTKPDIDVTFEDVTALIVNIIVSEKILYTIVDSTINPFDYSTFGVRSTPSHQIGVIDEIETSVSESIVPSFNVSNATITVDNIGYVSVVQEAWDITRYEEADFDINEIVPAQQYDPSILTMDVVARYNISSVVGMNQKFYIGSALVMSTDASGAITIHDSKFESDGSVLIYNDNISVSLSSPNFSLDELEQYCDLDTRTIKNVDAIFAIITGRILRNRYSIDVSETLVGSYAVPYNDYVKVYVNGNLKTLNEHYTINAGLRNTISFTDGNHPSLYDQLTFDLYNFGQIFVTYNDVPMPIDYDPSDMIVIDELFGGWDTYGYERFAYDKSTTYSDIYTARGSTDEVILASINVYLYDHSVVNGEVVIDPSMNKTLYGYIHRILDTSNRVYYMFEFLNTPVAGDSIDISILQYATFNALANTVIDDKVFFLVKERLTDKMFEARSMDIAYIDETMILDYINYDDTVESIKAINKIMIRHQNEESMSGKLQVFDESGVEVTGFTATYEDYKTKFEFTDAQKYSIKMKTKEQP